MNNQIILASSSQTRQDLMNRLKIKYDIVVPNIDESGRPASTPTPHL